MFCNLLFPTRLVGDLFLFSEEEEEEDAFLSTFEGRKTGWLSHESVVAVFCDDDELGDDVDAIIFLLFAFSMIDLMNTLCKKRAS